MSEGEDVAASREHNEGDDEGTAGPAAAEPEVEPRLLCPCGKRGGCCCAACKSIFYCTPEHLKQDWDTHKLACKPIKKIKAERKRGGPAWAFCADGPAGKGGDGQRKSPQKLAGRKRPKPVKMQMHYRAMHMNRKVFDDSGEKYGAPPVAVRTGTRSLMPALEDVAPTLEPGESAILIVLPEANLPGADFADVPILLEVHRIG